MRDSLDYLVDVDELEGAAGADTDAGKGSKSVVDRIGSSMRERPALAVYWTCCGLFSHVYRNRKRSHFSGSCPGCSKTVHARIAPGGTRTRSFQIC
ncbi:MAG: hypothetical protein GC159_01055 [Phycisphaera sp.]|nr:hypothetical protein [Phycisphaera sp.]